MSDNAQLAAQISCLLSRRRSYLPILDGPRIQLPSIESDVIRKNNAVARVSPSLILLAGLPASTCDLFAGRFPSKITHRCADFAEASSLLQAGPRSQREPLRWARQKIGLGVLRALRQRQTIVFGDFAVCGDGIPSENDHFIVCEEGDDYAQVIAANYAYSLGAGLCLIPEMQKEIANAILEEFYGIYEQHEESATAVLTRIRSKLRDHAGDLQLPTRASLTFITRRIPWGIAFGEAPCTHLFSYPDLGISIINGLTSEQPRVPGVRVALLIDPGQVDARDVSLAVAVLRNEGAFIRGLHSRAATVYEASRMIELYPYDFLLISTHCGDAPGVRWTCEFSDSNDNQRVLVVDVAVGVTAVPGEDKLDVTQFTHFVSLDGVAWDDPDKAKKLDVGPAILDFVEMVKDPSFRPTRAEPIERVVGSAALRMYDGNYLPIPRSLASERSPIVINNACSSWHRLALTFTFGNARAYIGTLFGVSESEAQAIVGQLLGAQLTRPLSLALWRAQNAIYGDGVRRPYVLVGCHFQRVRVTESATAPVEIFRELLRSHKAWSKRLAFGATDSDSKTRAIKDYIRFLKREIRGIKERWLTN
jgi:hypothetical protein